MPGKAAHSSASSVKIFVSCSCPSTTRTALSGTTSSLGVQGAVPSTRQVSRLRCSRSETIAAGSYPCKVAVVSRGLITVQLHLYAGLIVNILKKRHSVNILQIGARDTAFFRIDNGQPCRGQHQSRGSVPSMAVAMPQVRNHAAGGTRAGSQRRFATETASSRSANHSKVAVCRFRVTKKRRISTTLLSCSEAGARERYSIICCTFSFC